MLAIFSITQNSVLGYIHENFAYFVVASTGLAGLWALLAEWLTSLRHKILWWFTAMAHISVVVQIILGVIQQVSENIEVDGFHMLYGFSALASVGIIFSYKSQLKHKKHLLFGLGGLFLMGLSIRAILVGA